MQSTYDGLQTTEVGTPGADEIGGKRGADVIAGLGGDDRLCGNGGGT